MNDQTGVAIKKDQLSSAKRALLEKRLASLAIAQPQPVTIPRDADGPALLSSAQERIWFLCQLEPDAAFYNMAYSIGLRGPLDLTALQTGLGTILHRHEVLRTRFVAVDGLPVQGIRPGYGLDLTAIDLAHLPAVGQAAEVDSLALAEARRPFDLESGQLLRVRLLRLGGQEHVLLLTIHHIAFDGWSVGILIREFAACYQAFCSEKDPVLPDLPVQYSDFAKWERGRLSGEVLKPHLEYWKNRLADAPTLDLPTDQPRPAMQSFRGALHRFQPTASLKARLDALSDACQVTHFTTHLAILGILLSRHCGNSNIIIGTVFANRGLPELENLLGCFLNTLAIRHRIDGSANFEQYVRGLYQTVLEAYAHQDMPFEKLVEELKLPRDPSRNPLFQVALVLHNAPIGELRLPGLVIDAKETDSGITRFDLTLHLAETADGLDAWWEYNTDIFSADSIARLSRHWQTLAERVAGQPYARIDGIPLLDEAERRQTLLEWNDTQAGLGQAMPIHRLFEIQAECAPDALAASHGEDRLSYRELNVRANRLAHCLRGQGVGPDLPVAVCLERSLDMLVAILAVLKAGGAYVPVDPEYPQERIRHLLEDSQAHWLITQERWLGSLPKLTAACLCLCLDRDRDSINGFPASNPDTDPHPGHLAYVIYTSGSTGRPKGVGVSHGNAAHSTAARINHYGEPVGCFLLLSSFAFDSSVAGLFWTLASGGELCLPGEGMPRDPAALAGLVAQRRVSHLLCLPSVHGLLLAEAASGQLDSLRTVIVAGEACPANLPAKHHARLPKARLHNEYGPTEGTVWTTVYESRPGDRKLVPPIGRPIANVRVYLLDQGLNPVPVGVAGELYIAGAGLARGYLGQAGLTAERFIPDPFGEAGGRLYRTGDLARFQPDGNIEFLGRIDQQVKIRGFRIELGEIEARLLEHPQIRKAVVVVRDDGGHQRLVAYVVPKADEDGGLAEALRAFLGQRLPEHMLPAVFVTLAALPLTPNGKLDRKALPKPDASQSLTRQYTAPHSPAERILAAIWAEVLGVERVGVEDNFFALGGDSIMGIQVVSRARQAGLAISPRDVLQHQTVAALALAATAISAQAEAKQEAAVGEFPLTPIQHWFFAQGLPNPHHWNQALLLRLTQPMDAAILQAAIESLATQHDSLRLRFEQEAGEWRQIGQSETAWPVFSQMDCPMADPDGLAIFIGAEAGKIQANLDLEQGPLWRAVLFGCERLLIVIHHLAVDGVSWRILLEDLHTACRQLLSGQDIALPAKSTAYSTWSRRLQTYADSPALQAEAAYWLEPARESVKPLPVDNPAGGLAIGLNASVERCLDEADTESLLREAPTAYRLRIDDILLAALAQTLCHWNGADSVLVDLEGHGREDVFAELDLSRTVGWFTSLFPVLLTLPAQTGPGEALKSVKEQLRTIPNKGLGYGVLRWLRPHSGTATRLAQLPQAQISFNYLGQLDTSLPQDAWFALAEEPAGPCLATDGVRAHELELNAQINAGRLRIAWGYGSARYRRETIEGLADAYLLALRGLIRHSLSPEAKAGFTPSDFPLAKLKQSQLDGLMGKLGKPPRRTS